MARHSTRKTAPPTRYGFDPEPATTATPKVPKRSKTTKALAKSQSTGPPVPKPKKKSNNKPFGYRKKKRDPNALPKPRSIGRCFDRQGHPWTKMQETKIRWVQADLREGLGKDKERYIHHYNVRKCGCKESEIFEKRCVMTDGVLIRV